MTAGTMPLDGIGPASGEVLTPLWGIDPSTLRVSVAVRHGIGALPYTKSLPGRAGYQDDVSREAWWHAEVLRELTAWLKDLARTQGAPAQVRLEEPFGGSDKPGRSGKIIKPRPSSHRAFGVVLAAIGLALPDVPVSFVGPTTWKARALGQGHGFAKKPEIMSWACRTFGYIGGLEDEADALGIAESLAVDLAR